MPLYIGNFKDCTITIATDDTTSAEVDLGADCDLLQVIIPALTACTVKVQVAEVTSGTFQDLGSGQTTVSGTGSYSTMFKLGGYRYIKLVTSAAQAANRTFRVRGAKS